MGRTSDSVSVSSSGVSDYTSDTLSSSSSYSSASSAVSSSLKGKKSKRSSIVANAALAAYKKQQHQTVSNSVEIGFFEKNSKNIMYVLVFVAVVAMLYYLYKYMYGTDGDKENISIQPTPQQQSLPQQSSVLPTSVVSSIVEEVDDKE